MGALEEENSIIRMNQVDNQVDDFLQAQQLLRHVRIRILSAFPSCNGAPGDPEHIAQTLLGYGFVRTGETLADTPHDISIVALNCDCIFRHM